MSTPGAVAPVLERYLHALFGDAPAESLVELRFRIPAGMGHNFHPASDLARVAAAVHEHAARTDVYVGVLPRTVHHGGLDALVDEASVAWADCDSAESLTALRAFPVQPSIWVASGTGRNVHAYWLLTERVPVPIIADANRRLAAALGADVSCADPARILRPPFPGRNFKHVPPAAVCLLHCDASVRHRLGALLAALGEPSDGGDGERARRERSPRATDDPLLALSPRVYVEHLLGEPIRRDGKIRCPFHADRTPSLHVYAEPERGWYCYGCRQGGSVYDLAARLLGHRSTRGRDFVELRRVLGELLRGTASDTGA